MYHILPLEYVGQANLQIENNYMVLDKNKVDMGNQYLCVKVQKYNGMKEKKINDSR